MTIETAYQRQARLQRERQEARAKRMEKEWRAKNKRIKQAEAWGRKLRAEKQADENLDHDYSMNG